MYRQVTDQLRDAIGSGSLVPETRLPSIREMARELRISEITVKRAYRDLETEGYIVTRPGLGSFVAGLSRERLREEKLAELKREITKLARTAETFGISIEAIERMIGEIRDGKVSE